MDMYGSRGVENRTFTVQYHFSWTSGHTGWVCVLMRWKIDENNANIEVSLKRFPWNHFRETEIHFRENKIWNIFCRWINFLSTVILGTDNDRYDSLKDLLNLYKRIYCGVSKSLTEIVGLTFGNWEIHTFDFDFGEQEKRSFDTRIWIIDFLQRIRCTFAFGLRKWCVCISGKIFPEMVPEKGKVFQGNWDLVGIKSFTNIL